MSKEHLLEKASLCSKCGKCRTVCPTFIEETDEILVARGRIHLSRQYASGELPYSRNFRKTLSTCLLCMRCSEHCPNSVEIKEVVVSARELLVQEGNRGFAENFLMNHVISRKRPLRLALKMMGLTLRAAETARLEGMMRKIMEKAGLDRNRALPPMPSRRLQDLHPFYIRSPGNSRKAIFFPGCSFSLSLTGVGTAIIDSLVRNGTDVILPDIGCCGMPVFAAGYGKVAEKTARRNVALLKSYECDTVVVGCGSCGFMLGDIYRKILGESALGLRVVDFSDYLLETGFKPGTRPAAATLTYHDPCHLNRGMGVREQPRALLKRIPGVEFAEMDEADACCGCGGSFSIKHYELSGRIRRNKLNMFQRTRASTLATGCPACILHLRDGFESNGLRERVLHTAEIVAMTYKPA